MNDLIPREKIAGCQKLNTLVLGSVSRYEVVMDGAVMSSSGVFPVTAEGRILDAPARHIAVAFRVSLGLPSLLPK